MANDNSTDDRGLDGDARPDFSALASTVISVLSDKTDEGTKTVRSSIVQRLVKASLRRGTFSPELLIKDLEDNRLSPDEIVDIYIPQAALVLGEMWVGDAIGFAEVTIASSRLQGLLTLLAPPWSARITDERDETCILLVLQSGDAHTLGPHVATAQLRRMGASVRILFGPDVATLLVCLAEEAYDLVMFSCSSARTLGTISEMVGRIKSGIAAPPPLALGGLILGIEDRLKERTGVDLVTDDIKVAFKLCDKNRYKSKSAAH